MSELLRLFQEKRKNIYTVEKILEKKRIKGKIKYLIKWKGYSKEESTWEPIQHLKFVKEMVKEFEEREKREDERRKIMMGKIKEEGVDITRIIGNVNSDSVQCEKEKKGIN